MFLEVGLNVAGNVGDTEGQPVEEKQRQAGAVFLEVTAVSALDAKEAVKPIEMIQVAGKDAEDLELEPAHFENDGNKTDGEEDTGGQAVDGVLAQRDRCVSQQKGKTSYELRAIPQSMKGHGHGDD